MRYGGTGFQSPAKIASSASLAPGPGGKPPVGLGGLVGIVGLIIGGRDLALDIVLPFSGCHSVAQLFARLFELDAMQLSGLVALIAVLGALVVGALIAAFHLARAGIIKFAKASHEVFALIVSAFQIEKFFQSPPIENDASAKDRANLEADSALGS